MNVTFHDVCRTLNVSTSDSRWIPIPKRKLLSNDRILRLQARDMIPIPRRFLHFSSHLTLTTSRINFLVLSPPHAALSSYRHMCIERMNEGSRENEWLIISHFITTHELSFSIILYSSMTLEKVSAVFLNIGHHSSCDLILAAFERMHVWTWRGGRNFIRSIDVDPVQCRFPLHSIVMSDYPEHIISCIFLF